MSLEYSIRVQEPKIARTAMMRGAAGRLLVSAGDKPNSLNDGDQLTLPTFDRFGNAKAVIDRKTGEVVDQKDHSVAGKIAQSG